MATKFSDEYTKLFGGFVAGCALLTAVATAPIWMTRLPLSSVSDQIMVNIGLSSIFFLGVIVGWVCFWIYMAYKNDEVQP